ncbi:hypothetical protein BT93_E2312 [Corymbia citriodora subsp. variegata]|nr:hypothetical protein BT93_E2312 [Corymbia citriodora subsp. variegata]
MPPRMKKHHFRLLCSSSLSSHPPDRPPLRLRSRLTPQPSLSTKSTPSPLPFRARIDDRASERRCHDCSRRACYLKLWA